jgi:hypothetical protein
MATMKPRLLFIDHHLHQLTRSSEFFIAELLDNFAVSVQYVRTDGSLDPSLYSLLPDYDYVVLWQLDYLAPLFIAAGKRTVVIPMYDGSAPFEDTHWMFSSQARFINFSLTLHTRICAAHGSSLLLKYFLPPQPLNKTARFSSGLRAFFWERTPQTGFDRTAITSLLGHQLRSLHVHRAPDPGQQTPAFAGGTATPFLVTESTWFDQKHDYYRVLDTCNVFVAPRMSEGIGMAMLEAMSRGMLVIASDDAVHNEYISNWVNGVLFNPRSVSWADFSRAQEIGQSAFLTAKLGYEDWCAAKSKIVPFIKACPQPSVTMTGATSAFCAELCKAYMSGIATYTAFLRSHAHMLRDFCPLLTDREFRKLFSNPTISSRNLDRSAPCLPESLSINFADPSTSAYCGEGWSTPEPGARWIEGHCAELFFQLDQHPSPPTRMTILCRTLREIPQNNLVCLLLNEILVASFVPSSSWKEYTFEIPTGTLTFRNLLRFHAARAATPRRDTRNLSLCIRSINFSGEAAERPLRKWLAAGARRG